MTAPKEPQVTKEELHGMRYYGASEKPHVPYSIAQKILAERDQALRELEQFKLQTLEAYEKQVKERDERITNLLNVIKQKEQDHHEYVKQAEKKICELKIQ